MLGRKDMKRGSGGLGGKRIVHEQLLPSFLQKLVNKNTESETSIEAKRNALRELREDGDDETPLIIADDSVVDAYNQQEEEAEKKRTKEEDERKRINVMKKSKFHTTTESTHVFQNKQKKVEEKIPRTNKKRKLDIKSNDKNTDYKKARTKGGNLLSFDMDEEEEDHSE